MTREEIYNEIKKKNADIDEYLIPEFLTERIIKVLPLYIIEYCINFKEAQEKIIALSDNELLTFYKIINCCVAEKQDWVPASANYIRTLDNPHFENLMKDLKDKDLTEGELKILLFITNNYSNFYKIESYEQLKNFISIKNELIEKYSNTEDPSLILLSKYGISYDRALSFYKRYGKDLSSLPPSEEKNFLEDIESIIKGNGTKERQYYNLDFINNLDSNLRNLFVKIYNKFLFKVDSNTESVGTIYYSSMEVPIYDAGVDFYMSIYSYGLATGYEIPENFSDDWNRPSTKNEHFCNSIISSSNMRISVKHCIYGFNSFELNDFALMGSNDLGTGSLENNPDTTNFYNATKLIADVEFRIPKEIINYTRFTNNEIYRKRRRIVNNRLEKVTPDYIVYLKESSDTNIQNDPIWQKSLKAATDFQKNGKPLPIVVVDCEKCLLHHLNVLNEKINDFLNTYEYTKDLMSIIELLFTLLSGYQNKKYLSEKYLNTQSQMNYLDILLNHISKMGETAPNNAIASLDLLLETLELEHIKKLASPYWVKKYTKGEGLQKPISVYEIINNLKLEIQNKHKDQIKKENLI